MPKIKKFIYRKCSRGVSPMPVSPRAKLEIRRKSIFDLTPKEKFKMLKEVFIIAIE